MRAKYECSNLPKGKSCAKRTLSIQSSATVASENTSIGHCPTAMDVAY